MSVRQALAGWIASSAPAWVRRSALPVQLALLRRRCEREIRAIVLGDRPLVVGPWLGEVGYEVLYWRPFLRRLTERYRIDPRRVTVISRGGAQPWYRDFAAHYLDVLDYCTPDELRASQAKTTRVTPDQKQWDVGSMDAEVLARMRADLPEGYALLHPSVMYRLFEHFWGARQDIRTILRRCRFESYPVPEDPAGLALPRHYVAAKFYFSRCFPRTEENAHFITELLGRVAKTLPVVSLETGLRIDDHVDWNGRDAISLERVMSPRNNLAVQSVVISRAEYFIGTYGGFSYLAPFYGKRSLSFFSERNFRPRHLDLIRTACRRVPGGWFGVADARTVEVDAVHAMLSGATA